MRFIIFTGNFSWAGLFFSPAAEECSAPTQFVPLLSLTGEESIQQSAQQFSLALGSLKQVCDQLKISVSPLFYMIIRVIYLFCSQVKLVSSLFHVDVIDRGSVFWYCHANILCQV
jgi:hypothetical protein